MHSSRQHELPEKPREALILKAREAGYESIALVVMMTPLKTCLKRNKKRSRVVPEDMVRLFHAQMVGKEKPTESEGLIIEARPGPDAQHLYVKA